MLFNSFSFLAFFALLAGVYYALPHKFRWPLLLAAACLYSHFGVSGEISEIRGAAFGPEGSEPMAARWNRLHRLSVGIYLAVSACVVWLVVLHAGSDSADAQTGP